MMTDAQNGNAAEPGSADRDLVQGLDDDIAGSFADPPADFTRSNEMKAIAAADPDDANAVERLVGRAPSNPEQTSVTSWPRAASLPKVSWR